MSTYETVSVIAQQGQKACLRAMQQEDRDRLKTMLSHPEVRRHILMRSGAGPQQLDKLVKRMLYPYDPCALHAGIHLKGNEELVGTVSLQSWNRHEGKAVLGYMVDPLWWGRGLASEAVGLLLDYSIRELGLVQVEGRCRGDNYRSERVMLANGMKLGRIMPMADGSGDVMKVFTLLHN
ncbi:hypothetical protein C2I18_06655 [Paenibacillus sp. PK3_47]|uniref:GNAT family N-acetyltransferase n=1 Tax=Paenibacillus sp. PK3_47 TaxID=2072642 RepID=UPI00201D9983|nr:GNAT family N-acetyltransferase [Paenibacillus sp. PK3_47]UQZ33266.1 hypothetical protein C2I18_06655 [Paenibacillus sp. PK3_47]